jgi:hypothetical protein
MPRRTGSTRPRALPRLSPRERLLFEVGIKLGGIFHQYLGIPVTPRTAPALARSIEQAVSLQPFVRAVRVKIDPARGGPVRRGRYGYRYLTAEMVRARVTVGEGRHRVVAELSPDRRLRYPLMKVVKASRGGVAEPR